MVVPVQAETDAVNSGRRTSERTACTFTAGRLTWLARVTTTGIINAFHSNRNIPETKGRPRGFRIGEEFPECIIGSF
jgi:hypothetical protein